MYRLIPAQERSEILSCAATRKELEVAVRSNRSWTQRDASPSLGEIEKMTSWKNMRHKSPETGGDRVRAPEWRSALSTGQRPGMTQPVRTQRDQKSTKSLTQKGCWWLERRKRSVP